MNFGLMANIIFALVKDFLAIMYLSGDCTMASMRKRDADRGRRRDFLPKSLTADLSLPGRRKRKKRPWPASSFVNEGK